MSRPAARAILIALSFVASAGGCTAPSRLAYSPGELRAELRRRAPGIPAEEVAVPFEVDAARVALAREAVRDAGTDAERLRALTAAFFDPRAFGLRASSGATATAEETLRNGEGSCLSLASAFIGLARAVGLRAYYMDASTRVHETRYAGDGTTVNIGHVTAMVRIGDEEIGLDFERLGRIRWYRVIDDLEALAHFYNNRGFDLVDAAEDRASAVDWAAVAHQFRLAVQVAPGFALAWNNLGIAAVRLGRDAEAIEDYRTAIARDPRLAAPYNNLGSLYLRTGDVAAALRELEAAARLEPSGPHIRYNLAMARLRHGDRRGAMEALRDALELRREFPEAKSLLEQLAPAGALHGD